jgi:tetratricopeptide (TPR) repeat protein
LREYGPSHNIRIAIAGRDPLVAQWDPLRPVTKVISLDVFTEQESDAFLDAYEITNRKRRAEIIEWSGRLPVLMSWLAAPQGNDSDLSLPSHDIVERFLRWVTEPMWRQVALLAAIPLIFNADILKLLLHQNDQMVDEQAAFEWLQTMPFVQTRLGGWQYHPIVRRMMLHYQRQKSPSAYRKTHQFLADYYNTKRNEQHLSDGKEWANEQWRMQTLAYVYHFLIADSTLHWEETVSLFLIAVRKRRGFATEIIETLCRDDVHDELHLEQRATIQLFHEQLQAIKEGNLQNGFEMFDTLCEMTKLSSQAKCYAFAYRGECYRLEGKVEKALLDFGEALHYFSDDSGALVNRGVTYLVMERYEEALADFTRAITLDEKSDWYRYCRSQIYFLTHQLNAFEMDLNTAIELAIQACALSSNKLDQWRLSFNQALYYLFGLRQAEASSLYTHLIATCTSLSCFQAVTRKNYASRTMRSKVEHLKDHN